MSAPLASLKRPGQFPLREPPTLSPPCWSIRNLMQDSYMHSGLFPQRERLTPSLPIRSIKSPLLGSLKRPGQFPLREPPTCRLPWHLIVIPLPGSVPACSILGNPLSAIHRASLPGVPPRAAASAWGSSHSGNTPIAERCSDLQVAVLRFLPDRCSIS
jgi:hypothetical protein